MIKRQICFLAGGGSSPDNIKLRPSQTGLLKNILMEEKQNKPPHRSQLKLVKYYSPFQSISKGSTEDNPIHSI